MNYLGKVEPLLADNNLIKKTPPTYWTPKFKIHHEHPLVINTSVTVEHSAYLIIVA